MTELSPRDLEDLARAKEALSQPSLAIRIADRLSTPVEALVKRLPAGAQDIIHQGTHAALDAAFDVALHTLASGRGGRASDTVHRGLVVAMCIDHYQSVARAHFTVRRFIRTHGEDAVRRAYAVA